MRYFGQDSPIEYSGEKFKVSWKEGLEIFYIYSKEYKKQEKN